MPQKNSPSHLSATQTAKRLGVHASTVCEWIEKGAFPGTTRLGRTFRIPTAEVERVEREGFSLSELKEAA